MATRIHVVEIVSGPVPTEILVHRPAQCLAATSELDIVVDVIPEKDRGRGRKKNATTTVTKTRKYFAILLVDDDLPRKTHRRYLLLEHGTVITEDHIFLHAVGDKILVEYMGPGEEMTEDAEDPDSLDPPGD